MAREQFIHDLRLASQMLTPFRIQIDWDNKETEARISRSLYNADLWLTPKMVEGFDPSDFVDWPSEQRVQIEEEVARFHAVAQAVPADGPATKDQSDQGRKHLERIIEIVGSHLTKEWLDAQRSMIDLATKAAKDEGWYCEEDEKEVLESLLGRYRAPRLRIRTRENEVVLDPVARFGSGEQGIVDLVVMPTYETAYLVAFKNNNWQIVSPRGSAHRRPLTQSTLVNTITGLSHT